MRRLALIVWTCALGAVRAPRAQVTGTLDLGLSAVRYDGFLASAAASLTPALRWEQGSTVVHASASYLRFESGNHSLAGQLRGAWLMPLGSRWRGEIAAAAGASEYADFARFRHGIVEGRLHLVGGDRGAWAGGTAGGSSFGGAGQPVVVAAAGVWTQRAGRSLLASLDRSRIGDTVYSDLRTSGRLRRGIVVLAVGLGARFWSRGGGRGVYGEGSATLELSRRVAVVLAGGRYPTDAISGSIAGRYVRAALRIGAARGRSRTPRPPRPARVPSPLRTSGAATDSAPRAEIVSDGSAAVRLVIHAREAARVEIAGDFTEWQPVALTRAPQGHWEVVLPLPRGVHRMNVRVDGGAWVAPAGTARIADDYGGAVGVFVVP